MNVARWLAKCTLIVLTLVILVSAWTFFASASHNFSDIPDSLGVFHSAVEWMKNRAITSGCTPTTYCPNDPVTRVQMALFMQRLGGILTPFFLDADAIPGALDPDAGPTICQTMDFATTNYPRSALIDGQAVIVPAGPMGFRMYNSVSTDGGTSWSPLNFVVQGQTGAASGEIHSVNSSAHLGLNVGTTYRFGITIDRWSGTADILSSGCEMHVQIINRTGASTPLRPAPLPAPSPLRP